MVFNKELLQGKVAIVTGGGTGIGEVIASEFARHGADVAITSRNPEHHTGIVEKIDSFGRKALTIQCDVRQPDQVEAMVAQTVDKLGRLDILVNNAAGNFVCPMENLSYNGWKSVVDIVLNGTYICSKAALPALKESGDGNILTICATYAWVAAQNVAHSGAAKAGVLNLTRSMAVEWAKYNIRSNAVTPGPISGTEGVDRLVGDAEMQKRVTGAIPMRRFGTKEDIANAILYLVSPAASYVTGANITVDGGSWLNYGGIPIPDLG
jgi:NAD(P)-dependent dehydrogenase (short-subunit alcohol dehydrogenase family)